MSALGFALGCILEEISSRSGHDVHFPRVGHIGCSPFGSEGNRSEEQRQSKQHARAQQGKVDQGMGIAAVDPFRDAGIADLQALTARRDDSGAVCVHLDRADRVSASL